MRRIRGTAARRAGSWRMAAFGIVALALLPAGCSEQEPGTDPDAPVLAMAAASLSAVMPELIARFRDETGIDVTLVTGSTGNLASQIRNGAPADVIFAADEATVERLAAESLIRSESVQAYAEGRLAVVWREGVRRPTSVESIASDAYDVVAIANPEVAPYGIAAREALQRAGIWDRVSPSLVLASNVAGAYQFVLTGNADVAVVALSVIDRSMGEYLAIEGTAHSPIRQAAGIVSTSTNPGAERLLEFVTGEEGRAILEQHGFGAPEG